MRFSAGRRDIWCGGVIMLIGAVAVREALHHRLGTLVQMQAGYFPLLLGLLLLLLGPAIALAAFSGTPADGEAAFAAPDWRGFAAIVMGVASFIGVGTLFGLAPATFCCVFIAAIGDRLMTWLSALVLAVAITAVAVIIFAWLLQVQFPVLQLPSS